MQDNPYQSPAIEVDSSRGPQRRASLRLFSPLNGRDVARRTGCRLIFCAVPYLTFAFILSMMTNGNRSLAGWTFWLCVVIIPLCGFVVDLLRWTTSDFVDLQRQEIR